MKRVKSLQGVVVEIHPDDYGHARERHPEVTLEKIITSIKRPNLIIQSKWSNRSCLFYKNLLDKTYFCTVVEVYGIGLGRMRTAYKCTHIKKGIILYEN